MGENGNLADCQNSLDHCINIACKRREIASSLIRVIRANRQNDKLTRKEYKPLRKVVVDISAGKSAYRARLDHRKLLGVTCIDLCWNTCVSVLKYTNPDTIPSINK